MTTRRLSQAGPRWLAWTVLVVAGVLLVGTLVAALGWSARTQASPIGNVNPAWSGRGPMMGGDDQRLGPRGGMMGGGQTGPMMGGGMMGGHVWLVGDGVRVDTIAQARARATQAASASGLTPGDVMQFSNNLYVELKDAKGQPTTEVLVDPATGSVSTEPGPAMMWNTGSRTAAVSAEQAVSIANSWLQANAAGQTVDKAGAFPGYYTLDTMSGGATVGMMSVNATTGAVWYHTWHGRFIAEEEA